MFLLQHSSKMKFNNSFGFLHGYSIYPLFTPLPHKETPVSLLNPNQKITVQVENNDKVTRLEDEIKQINKVNE